MSEHGYTARRMALISVVRRWPTLCFFVHAYALSGIALAVIGLPRLNNDAGHHARPRP